MNNGCSLPLELIGTSDHYNYRQIMRHVSRLNAGRIRVSQGNFQNEKGKKRTLSHACHPRVALVGQQNHSDQRWYYNRSFQPTNGRISGGRGL
ncbi:hypothetical protein CGRA01v4_07231 [Colletotrichum graminicola]|nr:hypothetical protein CGRA01v4_07231 [Colletotrichum graminicola]